MALTKETIIDQITVNQFGVVMVREATTVTDDGEELGKKYHRYTFPPESDVSNMPTNVQAICQTVWTPEIIAAYKVHEEANKLPTA